MPKLLPTRANKAVVQISLRADDAQQINALVAEWRKHYGPRLRGLRVEAGTKSVGDWFAYGTLEVNDAATHGEPVSANALTDEERWQNTVRGIEPQTVATPLVTTIAALVIAAIVPVPSQEKKLISAGTSASKPLSVQAKARISRRREINRRPADQSGEKVCTGCGLPKPFDEFAWRSDRNSYTSKCKACRNKKDKERYADNPSQAAEHSRKVVAARKLKRGTN